MIKLKLSEDQVRILMELLGASQGVFEQLSEDSVGVAKAAFFERNVQCQQFMHAIAKQFNEQVSPIPLQR